MSAAKEFAKRFRRKNLQSVYAAKIRESRAIGIDRIRPENLNKTLNQEIDVITRKVLCGTYRFTRYKQKLVSKGATKAPRVLSIPTARDRIVLRTLCELLQNVFPEAITTIPQTKIEALKTCLDSGDYQEFVKLDVEDFYGSIPHDVLMKAVRKRIRKKEALSLISNAVETPTVPGGRASSAVAKKERGIPQGLSISNQLAEIAIREVDGMFIDKPDLAYFRYVDDILILTQAGRADETAKDVIKALFSNGLTAHDPKKEDSKSRIGLLSEKFGFLGYQVCGTGLTVRNESVHRLESSLAAVLTAYRYKMSQAKNTAQRNEAIALCNWRINLKITGCIFEGQRRGWVFYFSQITETSCLRALQGTMAQLIERFKATGLINPKSFLKTYYEAKRKDKSSHKYIPNYDTMPSYEKREILSLFVKAKTIAQLSDERVDELFKKRIKHAVKELEEDLAGLY